MLENSFQSNIFTETYSMDRAGEELISYVQEGIVQLCNRLKELLEEQQQQGGQNNHTHELFKEKICHTFTKINNFEKSNAQITPNSFSSVFEPFIEWLSSSNSKS